MKNSTLLILLFSFFLHAIGKAAPIRRSTDSIVEKLAHEEYDIQISSLKKIISQLPAKDFDDRYTLSKYGYQLAKRKADSISTGVFARNLGGALAKMGKLDSASHYYYQSLDLLTLDSTSEELGYLYDDMARMYRKLNQPNRAIHFYDLALDLYQNTNNLEGIARIYNESGVVYRELGELETSTDRFLKSYTIQKKRNDSVGMGYALEFLGYNKIILEQYDEAEEILLESLEIREKIADSFALMLNYTALAELYQASQKFVSSIQFFNKSNDIAEKIKYIDIQQYNHMKLVQNYEEINEFQSALHHLKIHQKIKDSLNELVELKNVEEISVKYETAQKENEIFEQRAQIAENQLDIQKKQFIIYGISVIFIFVMILLYIFIKRREQKHKEYRREALLKQKLLELESQEKLQTQRDQIARDLHDNIGAQLTFILSSIDVLKYKISPTELETKNKLDQIKNFASETIVELRDTIWAMNLSFISLEDLEIRIANYIEKANQTLEDLEIDLHKDPALPNQIKFSASDGLNIYRIIQESLNNAIKYADASKIKIDISWNDSIHFEISDNGKGFDPEAIEMGNGLYNMEKRALELKSNLVLNTEVGNGTRISFKVKNSKL